MNKLIRTNIYFSRKFGVRALTSQPLEKEVVTKYDEKTIKIKTVKKKPHRPPFMKNLFLGRFDSEVFGYPEVLNNDEQRKLDERVRVINTYVQHINVQSEKENALPPEMIRGLNDLNLFGLRSPLDVGGLELNETENCRVLEEVAQNSSLAMSLIIHQCIGVQIVLKASNQIQNKYLESLTNGSKIASFCILEPDVLDPSTMTTTAELSADESHFVSTFFNKIIIYVTQFYKKNLSVLKFIL